LATEKKIIFIDFNFSWKPNGGADVDTYHVLKKLHEKGYPLLFIGIAEDGATDRGKFDPTQLPFPAERVLIPEKKWNPYEIFNRIKLYLDSFKPNLIFLQHGFIIKIPITHLIKMYYPHIPLISRIFAHEIFCLRNPLRFKHQKPCKLSIFETPDYCRKCSLEGLKYEIKTSNITSWGKDYIRSKAYSLYFIRNYHNTVQKWDKIIVYNKTFQKELEQYKISSVVIPGGIEPEPFLQIPLPKPKKDNEEKIILMSGRCDEPTKGMSILFEAGKRLREKRNDFKIYLTSFNISLYNEWFIPTGWLSHEQLLKMYAIADICVVPSLWEEPFGLVVLESMATGRTVCASNIGGLSEIIQHNSTGILFEPSNYIALAKELENLLNTSQTRITLGSNARNYVIQNHTWEKIVNNYYIPLIEQSLPTQENHK